MNLTTVEVLRYGMFRLNYELALACLPARWRLILY